MSENQASDAVQSSLPDATQDSVSAASENQENGNSSNQPDPETNKARLADLLATIPKKRTGYFLFLEDSRNALKEERESKRQKLGDGSFEEQKISVSEQSKLFGEKWRSLSDIEKKGYVDRAAAEKEAYLQHIAEIKKLGGRLPGEVLASSADDAGGGETGDEKELAIPIARIRKIVNLDEDISSLSKDAVVFLSKATEEFTKWLGKEAESVAAVNNRRKVTPADLVTVAQTRTVANWLHEDITDFARKSERAEQEENEKRKRDRKEKASESTDLKGIDSFFKKA